MTDEKSDSKDSIAEARKAGRERAARRAAEGGRDGRSFILKHDTMYSSIPKANEGDSSAGSGGGTSDDPGASASGNHTAE